MTESLGIVIPAYRPDTDILSAYVRELSETVEPAEIRIELDAPNPGTVGRLIDLPATINTVSRRRGKGAAITEGFDALETDRLAFSDGDGATPASELDRICSTLDGETDLAVGTRRHPDAVVLASQSRVREFLGDGFAWLAGQLLDVSLSDYQCGAKAITSEGWKQVRPYVTQSGFAWDIELIAVAGAMGLRIREIPIEWHDRAGSTVSPIGGSIELARGLLAARTRARRIERHTNEGSSDRRRSVDRAEVRGQNDDV